MTWKDILKRDDEKEDLIFELDTLIENFGEDKTQDDYEQMSQYDTSNEDIRVVVEFDRSMADDEGLDDDIEESELFDDGMAHYRIEFSTPKGKEIGMSDYTYERGYDYLEPNTDNLSVEELKAAIKGMKELR
tara:strand:+ start:65 stop:460 length:396 start_codon:yes stop_codon:yes gene_type:complete